MLRTVAIISVISLSIFVGSCNALRPAPTLVLELADKPAEKETWSEGVRANARETMRQALLDKFRDSEECHGLV